MNPEQAPRPDEYPENAGSLRPEAALEMLDVLEDVNAELLKRIEQLENGRPSVLDSNGVREFEIASAQVEANAEMILRLKQMVVERFKETDIDI